MKNETTFKQRSLNVLRSKRAAIITGFIIGCIWTIPSVLDTGTDAGFLAPVIFAYAAVGSVIVLLLLQAVVFGRWLARTVGVVLLALVLIWVYSSYQASHQLWCNGQRVSSYAGTACEAENR